MHFLSTLPRFLHERVRTLREHPLRKDGEFVLYWMRYAMRGEENQALDVAMHVGNELGLPVLVLQVLPQNEPYASDRHHTFVLEGAADVQAALNEQGITYAFHLERPAQPDLSLAPLADRAALVITEEMPVTPCREAVERLGLATSTPIIAVDTACVVPMQTVGKAFERAFAYRKATQRAYAERVGAAYAATAPEVAAWQPRDLPFVPVDFTRDEIRDLVRACDIDHSIGPVPHTRGGCRAGEQRWQTFKSEKLNRYHRLRNNALVDGVSRMSPYLHYGMVPPTRIAREAADYDHEGASKYLDELLIWRELAYAFCFYRDDHDQLSAVPDWAVETLEAHAADARSHIFSWETLARGRTGDALWDAAQRSLLMQGELHNNVRMTWGKAIVSWTRGPEAALQMMIDLNHRYALDGRDPASFGGLLWCLGQFDRPFEPPQPVLGTVRPRTTADHAKRLDPQAYWRKVTRPLNEPMPRVAIIGAGISGLMAARVLQDHGFPVTVFEKSRGVGGRMATRRTEERRIDHGAQFFTVRDDRFRRVVSSWVQDGVAAPWHGQIVAIENGVRQESTSPRERFVGTPTMNAIAKHLAQAIDVHRGAQIAPLQRTNGLWQLSDGQGQTRGQFDVVISSAPAAQSAELLAPVSCIAETAAEIKMQPCWAVMLALPLDSGIPFDAAFINDESAALAWIARNSSKPERDRPQETWVLHAGPVWSAAHIEDTPDFVLEALLGEFWKITETEPLAATYQSAHRWRFALPPKASTSPCLFDPQTKAVACGDWCGGPRVEGAFLSGLAAAGSVMGLLDSAKVPTLTHAQQPRLFD
ncbi:MAG: NAD(P)-binding protein [Planctomycetota bacterium]